MCPVRRKIAFVLRRKQNSVIQGILSHARLREQEIGRRACQQELAKLRVKSFGEMRRLARAHRLVHTLVDGRESLHEPFRQKLVPIRLRCAAWKLQSPADLRIRIFIGSC